MNETPSALRRFGFGVLWAVPMYVAGAAGGGFLIQLLSSNTHDGSLEAAMTGAFVIGPIVGVVGFFVGFSWAARSRKTRVAEPPEQRS